MPTPRFHLGLLLLLPCFLSPPASAGEADPELEKFVRSKVAEFHQRRLERLSTLKLDKVLARKNPYLLKAKNLDTPHAIVTELLDSHLAPQESGIFGSVMEQVALEVCGKKFGARKSAVEGIDMEFEKNFCTPEGAVQWEKIVELGSGGRDRK